MTEDIQTQQANHFDGSSVKPELFSSYIKEYAQMALSIAKQYKLRSVFVVCAFIISSLLEGIGLVALLPLLNLIASSGEPTSPAAEFLTNFFALAGIPLTLGSILLFIIAMFLFKAAILLLAMLQVGYTTADISAAYRSQLVSALGIAKWSFFVTEKTGNIGAAIGQEPDRVASAYVQSCRMVAAILQLIIYMIVAVSVSWQTSFLALVVGGFILWCLRYFIRMAREAGGDHTHFKRSLMSRLVDSMSGLKALKSMGRSERFFELMQDDIRSLKKVMRKLVVSEEGLNVTHEPLKIIPVCGALYIFIGVLNYNLSEVLVLAVLFVRIFQELGRLQTYFRGVAQHLPAFTFIQDMIDRAEAVSEKQIGAKKSAPDKIKRAIRFDNVTFAYEDNLILDHVSFDIAPRKITALIGASGAGKTTVVDLLCALIFPNDGQILIDDAPLDSLDLISWRHQIGYVPQELFLFHDTLRNNITLGESEIEDSKILESLKEADVLDYVKTLPEGLDTVVGEKGAKLSGGQRQRIAIARALVHKPALLVLDESTTALDPKTEKEICATLKKLANNVTILVISHQDALKQIANEVWRIENGQVIKG